MIGRKLSFFVLFTLTLAFTLYTPDIRWLKVLLICTAAVAAGSGITFLAQDEYTKAKQTGIFLIAGTLGIVFGFSLSAGMELNTAKVFTGLEIPRITSFTGVCVKDSAPGKDGGYHHYIDLIQVHSGILGASAGARGRVMVITGTGRSLFTGEKVVVTSGLSMLHSGTDIHFICYAKDPDITRIGYSSFIFRIRRQLYTGLLSMIETMGFPESALFKALFLGTREDLPPEVYQGFEKTGTLHILALSGLHAGIIYALAGFFFMFLPGKWIKYSAGFCVVLFYLFIVGPRPSLVRATIMIIIFGTAYLLSLEREPLNLLGIAGAFILITDPAAAFSLSFQLSFLALAGIIIISPPVTTFLKKYIPGFIALPLSLSIGAQVATAPVIFIHFGIVYPSGIIVTLLLIPLVTVFLWGGIIFLFLGSIYLPFVRGPGELFFSFLYNTIIMITSLFKKIPGIAIQWEWWYWIIFLLCMLPFLFHIRIVSRLKLVTHGNR